MSDVQNVYVQRQQSKPVFTVGLVLALLAIFGVIGLLIVVILSYSTPSATIETKSPVEKQPPDPVDNPKSNPVPPSNLPPFWAWTATTTSGVAAGNIPYTLWYEWKIPGRFDKLVVHIDLPSKFAWPANSTGLYLYSAPYQLGVIVFSLYPAAKHLSFAAIDNPWYEKNGVGFDIWADSRAAAPSGHVTSKGIPIITAPVVLTPTFKKGIQTTLEHTSVSFVIEM